MAKEQGLPTKAGIFESGIKDMYGVNYKDDRLLSCRNKALSEYEVKDGTKVICDRAFYDLKNLEKVVLPSSVKVIGEGSFAGCKALKAINIPEGVTELKQGVFRDCDSLEELTLPESIKNIDKFAFDKGLKVLTILSPDAEIHRYALLNCKDLKKVIVPEGSGKHYRTVLTDARIPAEVLEMNLEEDNKDDSIGEPTIEENNLDKDSFETDVEYNLDDKQGKETFIQSSLKNEFIETKNQNKERFMKKDIYPKKSLKGYIDRNGDWVINPEFSEAMNFSEGFAKVKYKDNWGVINIKGEWLIQPKFKSLGEFGEGLWEASLDDETYGFIDSKGEWVVQPEYQRTSKMGGGIYDSHPGIAEVKKQTNGGLLILKVKLFLILLMKKLTLPPTVAF